MNPIMKKKIINSQTAYNRTVTASPPSAARLPQNTSRASPFVVFCSSTFFCARKNASHFSLSDAKKRQLQPERYATHGLDWSEIINKRIRLLNKF